MSVGQSFQQTARKSTVQQALTVSQSMSEHSSPLYRIELVIHLVTLWCFHIEKNPCSKIMSNHFLEHECKDVKIRESIE